MTIATNSFLIIFMLFSVSCNWTPVYREGKPIYTPLTVLGIDKGDAAKIPKQGTPEYDQMMKDYHERQKNDAEKSQADHR
ncbi:MAG: hypothetical protein ABIS50_25785 [Luteolibacter sp.]|uniref:hypothetical protein n=1 Tax=Luteolibacter sp. TaxID=1962973 RepID=UPI0032670233